MTERRALLTLLAIFAVLLFVELPGSHLIEPDEARYAEIPREMLAAGDLVTPRLNGTTYYEKPPLLYWANAASFTVLGRSDFAARLPARLAALGTAALIAISLDGVWGLWAALILLSAPLSFVLGRYNVTDGLLAFGMTLTLVAMRSFLRRRHHGENAAGALALLGLGAALAVLAKGLVGIVLPGAVFLLWIAALGEWRRLKDLLLSPAPLVFLAVAAPWFVLMERANPGFSQVFFIREHLQRFATNEAKREGPIYYFVAAFVAGFLPWTIPFGAWLATVRWRPRLPDRATLRPRADELLLGLWFFVILVFFSLSKSKLLPYLLPAFPAAAALAARVIVSSESRWRRSFIAYAVLLTVALLGGFAAGLRSGELARYGAIAFAAAGGAAMLAGAWVAAGFAARDTRRALAAAALGWGGLYLALALALPGASHELAGDDLARAASAVPGAHVVAYRSYSQSLAWTLARPVTVADYRGELASDGFRPADLFWSRDEFWRRWRAGEPLAVVVRRRDLADWAAAGEPAPRAVASNKTYLVVTNVVRASPSFSP